MCALKNAQKKNGVQTILMSQSFLLDCMYISTGKFIRILPMLPVLLLLQQTITYELLRVQKRPPTQWLHQRFRLFRTLDLLEVLNYF